MSFRGREIRKIAGIEKTRKSGRKGWGEQNKRENNAGNHRAGSQRGQKNASTQKVEGRKQAVLIHSTKRRNRDGNRANNK